LNKRRKNKDTGMDDKFWPSFSDLMTSLFFIVIILFVIYFVLSQKYKQEVSITNDSLATLVDKYKKITGVENSLKNLENEYFYYNSDCKRYELLQNFIFPPGQAIIPIDAEKDLVNAGKNLKNIIDSLRGKDSIRYTLILEGRVAKKWDGTEQLTESKAKQLSFERGSAVYNLWRGRGINFDENLCEVIIAGSGYGGLCRYEDVNEGDNKRVVIHIIPKVGDFKIEK